MTAPLATTYGECRERFAQAAERLGAPVRRDPIAARGPEGEELTIDSVRVGAPTPHRLLVVLGGVHGVEGFIASDLQCRLLDRLAASPIADDAAVLVVHVVNPWGMAWGRRQNESNVDLNRNWRRSDLDPPRNAAYDELHAVACPDGPELPSTDDLLVTAMAWVAERGETWVRDAITTGQYDHPDGLHYGGTATEASNRVLERLVADLGRIDRALLLDLHTGQGPPGALTLLSDEPPGSAQHRFLTALGSWTVEATVDNPDATTGTKAGQIGNGIRNLLGGPTCHATTAEFGTTDDLTQLAATYLEQWVHRHGDRSHPDHAAVAADYLACFTPNDPAWVARCRTEGDALLEAALLATCR